MSADPLVDGDLALVDYLHPITLLQPDEAGNDVSTSIAAALRRNIPEREAASSGGRYTTKDTRFHFETDDATPTVADRIIDQDGSTFTILDSFFDTLASRWKCVSRELTVYYNLDTMAEIHKATDAKGTSGEQVRTWAKIASVTASITEAGMSKDTEAEKGSYADRTFEIILLTDNTVSPNHRIQDLQGNLYSVESSSNKDSITGLQSVICRPYPVNNALGS